MNWFGNCCVQCQRKLKIHHHGLCSLCNKTIQRFTYCGCCGSKIAEYHLHCGQCLQQKPHWDRMLIVGRYTEPLSILIHRFKFQRQFWLASTLSRLLLIALYDARRQHQLQLPEVIIPVPLHHFRQWTRGYNQAALLANTMSKRLNIPCRQDLIQRIKHTLTQRGLTAVMRRKNLNNAFQLTNKIHQISNKRVALIDDVITTGSTLNEIAKLLHKAGVSEIQVWGLAKV